MLDPEIAREIREGLLEVSSRDVGEITAERRIDELGLDSVSLAELVFLLEEKLDVIIEMEEMAEVETFADLSDLIKKRRGA